MRKITWLTLALFGFLGIGVQVADASPMRFTVQPEKSQVEFISGTQLGEFRGNTNQVSGEMVADPQGGAKLRLSVSVDLRTLKSDNAVRDQHMHDRLLEDARFPRAIFTATEFRPSNGAGKEMGEGTLLGTLSLHGVERPVSLPIRFSLNGTTLRGEGSLSVKLTDFQMSPPSLLGIKVRDQVTVAIRLVATSG
ncbi:MAG TPA: YceI family protein [Candidatus Methylomirabilis sp.]|nr:YceI family protein [Candidatus Methylomirabilis sp.]